MATIGLFMRTDALKGSSYVDENVDEKYIRVAIERAQYRYIRPIIGSGIYDQLQTQINAGTLTALNTTLLTSYIQPALEWWTIRELVFPMTYKFNNKSVSKKNSDNSSPIELNEALQLRDEFHNNAEELTESLRLYLLENDTDYPLYDNPGTGVDTVHPTSNVFSAGWYMGDSKGYKTAEERFENPGDC
jgi:hypothetical protein